MRLFKVVSGQKPREIAVRLLQRRPGGPYIEQLLDNALAPTQLSPADRHLCQELVYGILRWQATLDWLVARKTENRTQKPALQNLLRLGLYQIFCLDRIPHHAAVHETVQLARQSGLGPQAGFVNAVLRGYLREFDATRRLLAQLKVSQPPLGHSHPDWLAARWTQRWGPERAAQLMEWNNTPPAVFARVNTLKTDPARLLAQWRQEEVECDFVRRDWLEENLVFELKSHPPLARLPSFRQGLFYLQDPSTLLAPRELDPQPGQTVLDLCAAPGGKLSCLAQLMANQGQLLAHDTAPDRLKLIRENCARLGITCVSTFDPQSPTLCDRILVDVPCSNTGVMRRRVDLRWRLRPEGFEHLRATQLQLLRQGAALLRPGGCLVYSTCSLEPEENQDAVTQFLIEHPGFRLERQRELLPFADNVDGAFVARFTRDTLTRP
jgi:16S rRNA (cytosine967-C5)-methyltransferase